MNKKIIAGLAAFSMVLSYGYGVLSPASTSFVSAPISASALASDITSRTSYTYGDFNYVYNDDNTLTIIKYNGSSSSVTIPSSINGKKVTAVTGKKGTSSYGFTSNKRIQTVTFPDTVKEIGPATFCWSSVQYVNFGSASQLETIGECAFQECGLRQVSIPKGVQTINMYCFEYCKDLTDVYLPTNLKRISSFAFYDCPSLKNIAFPYTLEYIGSRAFHGCSRFTEVKIPKSVESIGYDAFLGCSSLSYVDIPYTVRSIGSRAFGYLGDYHTESTVTKKSEFKIQCHKDSEGERYSNEYYSDKTDSYKASHLTVTQHNPTVNVEETEPTCTEDGHKKGTCSICAKKDIVISTDKALDHDYSEEYIVQSQADTNAGTIGEEAKVCSRNAEHKQSRPFYFSYQPKLDDEGNDTGEVEITGYVAPEDPEVIPNLPKEVTVVEDGKEVTKTITKINSKVFPEDEQTRIKFEGTEEEFEKIKVEENNGHIDADTEDDKQVHIHSVAKDEAIAPTCTESGLTEGSHCSGCKEVIVTQEVVPPTGHDWTEWTVTKAPTCDTNGEKERSCNNCREKETEAIDKLGHNWTEWKVTKSATCTEKGEMQRTCKNGGEIETKDIPAKGHKKVIDPAVAPTKTQTGLTQGSHCSECGIKIEEQTVVPKLKENESVAGGADSGINTKGSEGVNTKSDGDGKSDGKDKETNPDEVINEQDANGVSDKNEKKDGDKDDTAQNNNVNTQQSNGQDVANTGLSGYGSISAAVLLMGAALYICKKKFNDKD